MEETLCTGTWWTLGAYRINRRRWRQRTIPCLTAYTRRYVAVDCSARIHGTLRSGGDRAMRTRRRNESTPARLLDDDRSHPRSLLAPGSFLAAARQIVYYKTRYVGRAIALRCGIHKLHTNVILHLLLDMNRDANIFSRTRDNLAHFCCSILTRSIKISQVLVYRDVRIVCEE